MRSWAVVSSVALVPQELRRCTFFTESPEALKLLTLFPKEFAKALNMISAMIALLVVGFGMPVSATRLAGAAQVASVCAQTAALSHSRYEMRRGKCYAA